MAKPKEEKAAPRVKSFPAVARGDAETLILGSMPGEESLRCRHYYAHPKNAFWPIVRELLELPADAPYEKCLEALAEAKIALWDVLESCVRPGSMDSEIREGRPNDFASLFKKCPRLRLVVFNGGTAERIFKARGLCELAPSGCDFVKAPSTSPAFASLGFAEKLAQWRLALRKSSKAKKRVKSF